MALVSRRKKTPDGPPLPGDPLDMGAVRRRLERIGDADLASSVELVALEVERALSRYRSVPSDEMVQELGEAAAVLSAGVAEISRRHW